VLQVHDEVVYEVDTQKVRECLKVIHRVTEIPLVMAGVAEPLVIPADISIGQNWYDTVTEVQWLHDHPLGCGVGGG
jgi:DNA polymerase I-like protein with 3'-5' exonuclease and polymerase domains